jgi:ectoine hydroxylase-related dioxygenase (phytanoyl-CoA dioxygenase family)
VSAELGIRSAESNRRRQFDRDGFQLLESTLTAAECDSLAAELTPLLEEQQRRGKAGGVRNLLRASSRVAQLARSPALLQLVGDFAAAPAFPVRAIFFDKNPAANWLVPWHQDLAIAVAARIETPGFIGWSVKDGVPHVLPPREVLETMLTVRLHLDACSAANGALQVIPGSHAAGVLTDTDFAQWKQRAAVVCEVPKGGALVLRPLLLHASSPAARPSHRRVLHLEYATAELPNGLRWFEHS